jgi:hypothetical protein
MIISVDSDLGYYGTFRSYSSVDAFFLDAAQPFASSSIKQNYNMLKTPMIQEFFCRWRDKGWKLAELNVGQVAFYIKMIGILMMILN